VKRAPHEPPRGAQERIAVVGPHTGVATLRDQFEGLLLVDTRLVRHEALVHIERHLDGPVRHDLLLHVGDRFDSVPAGRLVLCRSEILRVGAGGCAGRCVSSTGSVGEACVGHSARSGEVLPRRGEHATLAAKVAFVARDEIFGREHDALVGCDRESVREDLRSREGPARAALLLIADRLNERAPLVSGVERLGHILHGVIVCLGLCGAEERGELLLVGEVGAEERLCVAIGLALEECVVARHPGVLLLVECTGHHVDLAIVGEVWRCTQAGLVVASALLVQ
jgi:hypothetical protein